MYSVVNIPHASNKRAELTAFAEDGHAKVKVVDPGIEPPYNACGVCDMFIGDHMFEPDKRDDLRMMVARALVTAIEKGRDAGYRQAQADIRNALGVPHS